MDKNYCFINVIRWVFIFSSVYIYDLYGLVPAFIVLSISSILRPKTDDSILDVIMANKLYQVMTLFYFIIVLFFVFSDTERASELSTAVFVLVIGAPMIFILFWRDMCLCFTKHKIED